MKFQPITPVSCIQISFDSSKLRTKMILIPRYLVFGVHVELWSTGSIETIVFLYCSHLTDALSNLCHLSIASSCPLTPW